VAVVPELCAGDTSAVEDILLTRLARLKNADCASPSPSLACSLNDQGKVPHLSDHDNNSLVAKSDIADIL